MSKHNQKPNGAPGASGIKVVEPPAGDTAQPQVPPPLFAVFPGETPRAFAAFTAFFQLGPDRALQAVADQLDEKLGTVKKWSARFRWGDRIQSFHSGLLQQQAEAEAAVRRQQAADWAERSAQYREQEWVAAQKLRGAAQCFLESFGDHEVEKMTLTQVSRALAISSRLARLALNGTSGPEEPALAPIQLELEAALERGYPQPPALPAPGLIAEPSPAGAASAGTVQPEPQPAAANS
jgi:hypothetical protein